ncbi:EpsG family protein [Petrotoga sp. 9PW.55.5.1]|uniref:EpsG family protein n=1 Tax=Petrotoga sp. 9PW.55.5.1 TaxID=1308979 RepID=UPI00210565AE|nr:EpsG family protein [Petrotoga sp. 9PW.55.5.1]
MYMLYPMIMDSEQLRNFIAFIIIFVSLDLLKSKKLVHRILLFALILFSGTFHIAFLFYIPLIFINIHKNRIVIFLVLVSIITFFIAIMNNNTIPFIGLLTNMVSNDEIVFYLNLKTNLGYLLPVTLHLINLFMIIWSKNILSSSEFKDTKYYRLTDIILYINFIGIIYFPTLLLSLTFYRLLRNIFIINLIVYSNTIYVFRKNILKYLIYLFFVFLNMFLWFYFDLIFTTKPERVLIPFFTQNYFFN